MTEVPQPAAGPAARSSPSHGATLVVVPAEWGALVDAVADAVGPIPAPTCLHWRGQLDAVRRRVADLERRAPQLRGLPPGLHALVTLAAAGAGVPGAGQPVRAAATAVELAYRATLHHASVADTDLERGPGRGPILDRRNVTHVLDGDWSITQAAVLVAGVGPQAYRLLVRGYGVAQVVGLRAASGPAPSAGSATGNRALAPGSAGSPLLATAAALGELLAGGRRSPVVARRIAEWAGRTGVGATRGT